MQFHFTGSMLREDVSGCPTAIWSRRAWPSCAILSLWRGSFATLTTINGALSVWPGTSDSFADRDKSFTIALVERLLDADAD
jgi:hypothetical protein